MTQLSIELHDAELAAVLRQGRRATLVLSPAYVHAAPGPGRLEDVEIVLEDAGGLDPMPPCPLTIADGTLTVGTRVHHNLLSLPLEADGAVALELRSFGGLRMALTGRHVRVELLPAARR